MYIDTDPPATHLPSDLFVHDLVHAPHMVKNQKFVFADEVKKIRVDIGLSNEGTEGAQWLLDNDDVGVIGVEPSPIAQENLEFCGTINSYIPSLFLSQDKICKFTGLISEVFFKRNILNMPTSTPEEVAAFERFNPAGSITGPGLPGPEGTVFHLSPKAAHTTDRGVTLEATANFRLYPVLIELKDITRKYIAIGCALDNINGANKVTWKKFYSSFPDVGNSSLRKDVIEYYSEKNLDKVFTVPCFSLDSVLDYIDWNKFKFIECIKIDVEGKELDVLKSCKTHIDKVVYFRVEAFPEVDNNSPTFGMAKEIIEFMDDKDFELIDSTPGDYKFVNKKYKKLAKENNLSW